MSRRRRQLPMSQLMITSHLTSQGCPNSKIQPSVPKLEGCTRSILRDPTCPASWPGVAMAAALCFVAGTVNDTVGHLWLRTSQLIAFPDHKGHSLCRPRRPGPAKAAAPELGETRLARADLLTMNLLRVPKIARYQPQPLASLQAEAI